MFPPDFRRIRPFIEKVKPGEVVDIFYIFTVHACCGLGLDSGWHPAPSNVRFETGCFVTDAVVAIDVSKRMFFISFFKSSLLLVLTQCLLFSGSKLLRYPSFYASTNQCFYFIDKTEKLGNAQEMAQLERNSHSKN